LALPIIWAAIVIYNQAIFYPFSRRLMISSYEIELLLILFAPFVFVLPKSSSHFLGVIRKLYWVFFFGIFSLYAFMAIALLIFAGEKF
jgi:hypothetical protein